jgi:hypothetical protein
MPWPAICTDLAEHRCWRTGLPCYYLLLSVTVCYRLLLSVAICCYLLLSITMEITWEALDHTG